MAGTEGRKVKATGPLEIARLALTNDIRKARHTAQCASRNTGNAAAAAAVAVVAAAAVVVVVVVVTNSSLCRTARTWSKDKHITADDLWLAHSRCDGYEWLVTDMSGYFHM